MKKVLIVMMLLAQSAGVYAQANLEDRQTANTPPPITDDHTALKGQRQTPNHPTIRITRSDTRPQDLDNSIYDVDFVIQSNENIPDIGTTASYKIARCLTENCTTRDTTTTYIPSNITATSLQFARISAEITLNNLEDIRATWGFVLLRASASALRNANGIAPTNTNGETIEPDGILGVVGEGAIAKRNRTSPQITLTLRQIRYRGKSRSDLDGTLTNNDIYELVFWVIPDKPIPTLYDTNSYWVIHVSNTDAPTFHNSVLASRPGGRIRIPGRPDSFEFFIRVAVLAPQLESTKGFTVARREDDDLLDIWGNPPVRAEDGALIGTGIDGELLSTTIFELSLTDIQARIRAKVLLEGPLR